MEIIEQPLLEGKISWGGLIKATCDCEGEIPKKIADYAQKLQLLETAKTLDELVFIFSTLKLTSHDIDYLDSDLLDMIYEACEEKIVSPWHSYNMCFFDKVNTVDRLIFIWKFRDELRVLNAPPFFITCLSYSKEMFEIAAKKMTEFDISKVFLHFALKNDTEIVDYLCVKRYLPSGIYTYYLSELSPQIWAIILEKRSPSPYEWIERINKIDHAQQNVFIRFAKNKPIYGGAMKTFIQNAPIQNLSIFFEEQIPVDISNIPLLKFLKNNSLTDLDGKKYKLVSQN